MCLLCVCEISFVSRHQTYLCFEIPFLLPLTSLASLFSDRNVWCDKPAYLYQVSDFLTVQQKQLAQVDSWHFLSGKAEVFKISVVFWGLLESLLLPNASEIQGPLSSLMTTFIFNEIWISCVCQVCGEIVAKNFWKQLMTSGDTLLSENPGHIAFASVIPPKIGKSISLLAYEDLNL